MKYLTILMLLAVVSCSTSNDVVSNGFIQKRKYRKGYFINKGKTNVAQKTGRLKNVVISSNLSPLVLIKFENQKIRIGSITNS